MSDLRRWHAQAVAFAEDDVDAAHALLRGSGAEIGAWSAELDAPDMRLTLLFDRLPSWPSGLVPGALRPASRDLLAVAQAECLVAAGRPREAMALLAPATSADPDVVTLRAVMTGLARFVDGDVHGALEWSLRHLEQARADLDPDAIPGTTFPVDCDDAETPIYFDTKCTFFDLLEACHTEAGCLQIMRDSFVWLSPEGAKLQSGAATLERDSLSRVDNATLEAVNGVLMLGMTAAVLMAIVQHMITTLPDAATEPRGGPAPT